MKISYLTVLVSLLVSCNRDMKENEASAIQSPDSVITVSNELVNETETTPDIKERINSILKKDSAQIVNTDTLADLEVRDVNYYNDNSLIYITWNTYPDSSDLYDEHSRFINENLSGIVEESDGYKRQSLSELFVQQFKPAKYESIDLYDHDNKYLGKGHFVTLEFFSLEYEVGSDFNGVVAVYKVEKPFPPTHAYAILGDYKFNASVRAEPISENIALTHHILNKVGLPEENYQEVSHWHITGYNKIYTTLYYDKENYEVDCYLIETDADQSKIVLKMNWYENIRTFVPTGIFANGKPLLFLYLASPSGDEGEYRVAHYNGKEYAFN